MKKNNVPKLLEHYLLAQIEGREVYFDADEIDRMLDSFEETEDFTYYKEILSLGLKLHPDSGELKLRECKFHIYNEEYKIALDLLDKIAEANNQDIDIARLECYCALNQYKKVVSYIEDLMRSECDYIESIFEYIAPVLSDLDKNTEARDLVDRGLLLFPDNAILKDELCYLLELDGDFEGAIRICNELIDREPYSYENWFTLGRLYSMIGDFTKAIEAFDFALTCDESDVELKILKAYCLFMNESYEKAIEAYKDVAIDVDAKERIKPLMAECYIKMEDYEEAYHILKELLDKGIQTDDPTWMLNFIHCCVETEREKEASDFLLIAAEKFPENIKVLTLLALTYLENGKDDEALAITNKIFNRLTKANKSTEEECKTIFRKGEQFYFKGNLKKAMKYYKSVLRFQTDMPYRHLHMAMAYFMLGDMEFFRKHYKKVTPSELVEYAKISGFLEEFSDETLLPPHIPPEELTREFLNNKDNNN